MTTQNSEDDAFADARQVQLIAERIWREEHPGEPFPKISDQRIVALYDRAKGLADG